MRLLLFAAVATSFVVGCSAKHVSDRFAPPEDSGIFDAPLADVTGESLEPDADPNLGGPCVDDAECAKPSIACATFACDTAIHRCRATPDDGKCDDGVYCDGPETCDTRLGCTPGPVVDCSNGDPCSIDTCVEATHTCTHALRDADGDGDPVAGCGTGKDCDDHDPTISSKQKEVCANKKDDNCNGQVDESPCSSPQNSTCGDALPVSADGTYSLSFVGTARTVAASCAPMATYPRQVVVALKVPAGGPKDVDLVATPIGAVIALDQGTLCGDATTEQTCVAEAPQATSLRTKLRALAPGIYPVYVFAGLEGTIELKVTYEDPTPPPTNVTCGAAAPLLDGTTQTASLDVDLVDIGPLPAPCPSAAGPLVYRIVVPASLGPRDFNLRATAGIAGARPILGLRDAGCVGASDELRCGISTGSSLFLRALPPGTYYATLAATAPTDLTIEATLTAPTTAPADASCATAPELAHDTTTIVDLAGHEDSLAPSCVNGDPSFGATPTIAADAAYALDLTAASDVIVEVHGAGSDPVGVALATSACTSATFGCAAGYPLRLNRRALPAGSYRVVVESETGSQVSLSTFVRTPSAAPGPEGADRCTDAPIVIPSTGGFFVGSTAGKSADLDDSCDTAGLPKGGAPEVFYRLDLPANSRVIVDAQGSAYATILSIRQGASCPGVEVQNGCAAGYVYENAFLDYTLDAGTYWIVVDGFNQASGTYALDVRVAPPLN